MLTVNDRCHGFRLCRREQIAEIDADALVFEHEGTGAELVILHCEDDHKTFLISFRTPPADHTGVPHILEHSVLNGSRNYPVKEPFAELLKSSLYTFLNAMTYPDRTVYPVASRNARDFRNLTDVYLDAVFHPKLSENTFLQEGWHYQLESTDEPLAYSGVVYNEMKGAYSSPETLLHCELDQALFPDSIYAFSSGGDPRHIPSLTYADFVAFHRRHYHPSNSRIIIYGDVEPVEELAHLETVLGAYERQDIDSRIAPQPPLDEPVTRTATYPLSPDEDPARKSYLLRGYLLGHSTDPEYRLAMEILSHILCGTTAAPLRKALIDSELGEDTLNPGFEGELLDTYYAIGLKGADADALPEMNRIIDETLSDLAENGIDAKTVEASMNTTEFNLREANFGSFPKGLVYAFQMLSGWNYDADPLEVLGYEPFLASLREKAAAGGFFEGLIRRYLLDNRHQATVSLLPDRELAAAREAEEAAALSAAKATMAPEALAGVVQVNQALHEAQTRPDSPEDLATIPSLPLSSLEREAPEFPLESRAHGGLRLTFSPQPTNGILYLTLAFDAAGVPTRLLPYLPLFGRLTLQVGTQRQDFVALTQELGIHTGGVHAGYSASALLGQSDEVCSLLSYSGKALTVKIPKMVTLLTEILTEAELGNLKRVREIARSARAGMRRALIPSGHRFAAGRLAAGGSRVGRYKELTGGLSQYYFLVRLCERLESEPDAVTADLLQLRGCLLHRGSLRLHVTGSEAEFETLRGAVDELYSALPEGGAETADQNLPAVGRNEGFSLPSTVQYVGKGLNLYQLGYSYNANFEVLKTLLSRDYLWNRVRVQGGAYGCFAQLDSLAGDFSCVSYRDPNLGETIAAYDEIPDYLAGLALPERQFENLIIRTIGSIDAPYSPDQKGHIAFNRHLTGVSQADVQRWREQILSVTRDQVRDYAELMRTFRAKAGLCVFGSEAAIQGEAGLFDRVSSVFGQDAENG